MVLYSGISVASHRIASTSDEIRPVHCAPYTKGPGAGAFEKTEIDEMIKLGVIDRLRRNGTLP